MELDRPACQGLGSRVLLEPKRPARARSLCAPRSSSAPRPGSVFAVLSNLVRLASAERRATAANMSPGFTSPTSPAPSNSSSSTKSSTAPSISPRPSRCPIANSWPICARPGRCRTACLRRRSSWPSACSSCAPSLSWSSRAAASFPAACSMQDFNFEFPDLARRRRRPRPAMARPRRSLIAVFGSSS